LTFRHGTLKEQFSGKYLLVKLWQTDLFSIMIKIITTLFIVDNRLGNKTNLSMWSNEMRLYMLRLANKTWMN